MLDAKYRVEEALGDAISSIHMYRDALVEMAGDEGHRRTVRAAFVLTPHVPGEAPADWHADRPPEVFFREGYQQAFRFGAVTLRPGVGLEQCRNLLEVLVGLADG